MSIIEKLNQIYKLYQAAADYRLALDDDEFSDDTELKDVLNHKILQYKRRWDNLHGKLPKHKIEVLFEALIGESEFNDSVSLQPDQYFYAQGLDLFVPIYGILEPVYGHESWLIWTKTKGEVVEISVDRDSHLYADMGEN